MKDGGAGDGSERLWSAGLGATAVLRSRGYEAYLVGGCVRDRLLGRSVHDIDIATSALPAEVSACFARTIPTGLQHGTVTVLYEGFPFEVTTFRTESGYSDARRPDEVRFVRDIREDLARRDFTINAMAAGSDGVLIDPFGGQADLAACRVRCVGDAEHRFGEDALRMLRAIRFAAGFGFRLTLSAWRGIRRRRDRLRQVAMERVGAEWDKMMAGDDPDRAVRLLMRSGLLGCTKEPLPACLSGRVTAVPGETDPGSSPTRPLREIGETDARWIALLAVRGATAADARMLCRALRFSGRRETRIAAAITFHERVAPQPEDRARFGSAVLACGRNAATDWAATRTREDTYLAWLASLPIAAVGQLAVKGDQLAVVLGRPPGPWVADLLRRLLEEAAFGRVANETDALLAAASRLAGECKDDA